MSLLLAISKLLDSDAKRIAKLTSNTKIDGYDNWLGVNKYLGIRIKSILNKQKVTTKNLTSRQEEAESLDTFLLKYNNQVQVCNDNNIHLFHNDKHLFYVSYLHSLNHKVLQGIIIDINTKIVKRQEWIKLDSF